MGELGDMVCNKNKYQYVLLVFLLYFVLVFDRDIQITCVLFFVSTSIN